MRDDDHHDGNRGCPQDARQLILARRKRFVAIAIASAGIAAAGEACEPKTCLRVAPTHTSQTDAGVVVPIEPAVHQDAGADDDPGTGGSTAEHDEQDAAPPMPCLTPRLPDPDPPAVPRPCLSKARPRPKPAMPPPPPPLPQPTICLEFE